jgi:hypothetical protein
LLLTALVAFALLEGLLGTADPAAQDLSAALLPPVHPLPVTTARQEEETTR